MYNKSALNLWFVKGLAAWALRVERHFVPGHPLIMSLLWSYKVVGIVTMDSKWMCFRFIQGKIYMALNVTDLEVTELLVRLFFKFLMG